MITMENKMLNLSGVPYTKHPAFRRTYKQDQLTLGLFYPIEGYTGEAPTMKDHLKIAKLAEASGFAALWVRDVPLRDPNFGDLGQIYDPWVYLGYLASSTSLIALGTGAIVLPIRHPLHLAKAATSVDQISNGRLLLGIASGDRPVEFPAFGIDILDRGKLFREHFEVFKQVTKTSFKPVQWEGGALSGADMVPKPFTEEIPVFVTGASQQSMEWIAKNAHGWINYPRSPAQQRTIIQHWKTAVAQHSGDVFKPFSQSLYIDLLTDPDAEISPIHLGYRMGRNNLILLLEEYKLIGVNHVMLSLKYSSRPAKEVIEELAEYVVPKFPAVN